MKVLVVLSLLAFTAAKPQFFLPYTTSLLTPTVKASEDTPVIQTYTASYPHAGFPFVQAALPYNYQYPYAAITAEASRQKRDADAEAEADPALVYTTGLMGSNINYPVAGIYNQYSGFPAAVSTYTHPQHIPFTGISPYTGLTPYTTFPFFPAVSSTKAVTPKEDSESVRQKRDAEAEADPALVYTTGLMGPNINYPVAGIYNQYSGFPAAVSTYTHPQHIPFTGISPYTGLSPYTPFPFFPAVSPAKAVTAEEDSAVDRAKRSADAEADPQLLTTGFTGFSYPAVNTKTTPSVVTYNTFPTAYTGLTYPFQHGNYPIYGK